MNNLPEMQRNILELFYWNKMSCKEIAKIYDISEDESQMQRKIGVERITKISQITIEMYDKAINKL